MPIKELYVKLKQGFVALFYKKLVTFKYHFAQIDLGTLTSEALNSVVGYDITDLNSKKVSHRHVLFTLWSLHNFTL